MATKTRLLSAGADGSAAEMAAPHCCRLLTLQSLHDREGYHQDPVLRQWSGDHADTSQARTPRVGIDA